MSLAITVVMASVYLLSLQLMVTGPEMEGELAQQTQEPVESTQEALAQDKAPDHGSKSHDDPSRAGVVPEVEVEKKTKDKKEQNSEKHGEGHGEKASSKAQVKAANLEQSEPAKEERQTEPSQEEAVLDLSKKYRPRIIGRCKVLFDRFNKMELQANQFHSFAYSYDGKSGYCADSGAQASLKLAKEIALSDCEKNKASAESYAPCFIYSSEK